MNPVAEIGLLLATLTVLVLPLVPALREWLQPTDDLPLPVDQNATHHLRHFADSLRHLMDGILGSNPTKADLARLGNAVTHGRSHIVILQVPSQGPIAPDNAEMKMAGQLGQIVVLPEGAVVAPGCETLADIYALTDIAIGRGCSLRSCCAKGDMALARDVLIHRWIDAANITSDANLTVHGRITALQSIRFAENSRFVRAGAPAIYFGPPSLRGNPSDRITVAPRADNPRFLTKGDADISSAIPCNGNFVVHGATHVAAHTDVVGSIKSRLALHVGEDVQVAGSLVSNRSIHIAAGCAIVGPLISDEDIFIGPDCRIGSATSATTIICRRLVIAQGVVIHGVITTQDYAQVRWEAQPHARQ